MSRRGPAWRDRRVDSGDVEIATRDWSGCGPDLVLLHGAGPDQRSMARLAAALTPYFRVVTYDQRGCGASSAGPWTFTTALDDVKAVIDGYRLTNPVVAGHSLGGMSIAAWAEHHDVAARASGTALLFTGIGGLLGGQLVIHVPRFAQALSEPIATHGFLGSRAPLLRISTPISHAVIR
ncbi:MAG TPA: alpha/beta hydrolase, partial [Mycobacteriales bacterium]|nr:alpha/beta hydrolase [Mycobacteriales bacterium]